MELHPSVSAEFRRRVKRLALVFEADLEETDDNLTTGEQAFTAFLQYVMNVKPSTLVDITAQEIYLEEVYKF